MSVMNVVGRLGRDAEVRYTGNGTAVADLAVAYDYGRKESGGNRPTQWIRASLWGQQAESLSQYLTKGKAVALTLADVHVRTFDKKDGTTGHSLEGRVILFDFAPTNSASDQQPRQQTPVQPPQAQQSYQAQNTQHADFTDDIPF